MTKLYGIKNCDTVKKARTWLDKKSINYQFCDFREQGITATQVKAWIADIGLDNLINKRSTTWKNLSDTQKQSLNDKNAVALILENPTLIKRPLLEKGKFRKVGFKEAEYKDIFQ